MSTGPDVSVIIPTFNEGAWLAKTVDSMRAARTERTYELLVVDDGCTDGSVAAVASAGVRIVVTGGGRQGSIVARRTGAAHASGKALCFVDSHVQVEDHWLDCLEETAAAAGHRGLVTGAVLDARRFGEPSQTQPVWGYALGNWALEPTWHGYGETAAPRKVPLACGCLVYTGREWFDRIGGFDTPLREWGGEDIELSLRSYASGGDTVLDPRVRAYHRFKNLDTDRPSFAVSWRNVYFNSLLIAKTYFPQRYFLKTRQALAARADVAALLAELGSGRSDGAMSSIRRRFVRGFDDWLREFADEHSALLADAAPARRAPNTPVNAPGTP